eukprot:748047-Pleurochrysis_carterae.AAC.1
MAGQPDDARVFSVDLPVLKLLFFLPWKHLSPTTVCLPGWVVTNLCSMGCELSQLAKAPKVPMGKQQVPLKMRLLQPFRAVDLEEMRWPRLWRARLPGLFERELDGSAKEAQRSLDLKLGHKLSRSWITSKQDEFQLQVCNKDATKKNQVQW